MAVSQARWVVLLWLLGMGSLLLSLWASIALVPGSITWQEAVWAVLFGSAFLAVGAILVVRRPYASVGRICLLTGLTMAAAADLRTFAILLDRQPGPLPPAGAIAANLSSVGTSFAALVLGAILLARFPDGRDRGRLAALADVTAALATLGLLATLFVPGPIEAQFFRLPVGNPLGIDAFAGINVEDVANISLAIYGVSVIAAAAIVVRRYRRSGAVVRAQIRWVAAAGIVPIVLFLTLLGVGTLVPSGIGDLLWSAWILSTTLLPIAIGIAILRYRLYDIDRLISRTIAYAIVTALLAGALLATNLALTTVLVRGSAVEVAISTLVVAVLFQPLRRTVQRQIDRRFNRSHVDAQGMVSEFLARTRDEVDLDRRDRRDPARCGRRGPAHVGTGLAPGSGGMTPVAATSLRADHVGPSGSSRPSGSARPACWRGHLPSRHPRSRSRPSGRQSR